MRIKRVVTNMTFTVSFIVIFTIVVRIFYQDFAVALSSPETQFLQPDDVLPIEACQRWTDDSRSFGIEDGDGAESVPVLMYHRVIDEEDLADVHYDENGDLYTTILVKSEFEKQMAMLKKHDYTTLTSKELQLFLQGELNVPKNSIVLTFDDGYKDNMTESYPILKHNDLTAINFVITGAISNHDQVYDASKHQYLSVSDMKESCDVYEFQSHTYDFHKRTFTYSAYLEAMPEEEIIEDLSASITNLSGRNRSFAYPYGAYNEETLDILETLGFEMAFTVEYRDAERGENMLEIPRKEVYSYTTLEEFKEIIHLEQVQ